jgi:hypothetical protein
MSPYRTPAPMPSDKQHVPNSYIMDAERDIIEVLNRRARDVETVFISGRESVRVNVIFPRGGRGRRILSESEIVEFRADVQETMQAIADAHAECVGRINARLGVL